jgi:hypothetical protein
MENNRPRISSLTEKELAALLLASFFKVGKEFKISPLETKLFIDEVYKNQGWMYVDTFSEAFSAYTACELPEAENLRPYVSPLFISKLMKIYKKQGNAKKLIGKSEQRIHTMLSPEEKYTLFLKHIIANKSLPANPDWVSIYEYLSALKKLPPVVDWSSLGYFKKLKEAMKAVTEWTYKNFTITENLIYKYEKSGITTRIPARAI